MDAERGDDGRATCKSPESGGGTFQLEHDHRHPKDHNQELFRQARRIVMLFGVIVVTCFLLSRSANPLKFFNPTFHQPSEGEGKVKLERILERAATTDKTVIVTTLNEAWAAPNSMFDLFLESFHIGNGTTRLLKHLVVVALDRKAYDRCLAVHPHCYLLKTAGTNFSGEAFFMSPRYLQ